MRMGLPKLSEMLNMFSMPESQFESMVKSTTGVDLPPGPSASVAGILSTFEDTSPLGAIELPKLPMGFPGFSFGTPKQESTTVQNPPAQSAPYQPASKPAPQPKPSTRVYRRRGLVY